jgi:thiol-disulfide isomerase/thioredoxin
MGNAYRSALLTALLPAALLSGAADYYSTDFATISSAFTQRDADMATIDATCYNHLELNKPWEAGRIDSKGFVALCPTHSGTDEAQENWLIAPAVEVNSADACVAWKARSVHPDLPEAYQVMVSMDDSEEFTEIFSTDAENVKWTSRIASLSEYVGHKVKVAFVCRSVNKFLLAIDDLKIGVPKEMEFYVEDLTPRFITSDTETFTVTIAVTNVGCTVSSGSFTLADTDVNCMYEPKELTEPFRSGETLTFSASFPTHAFNTYHYSAVFEQTPSDPYNLAWDRIYCGDFIRKTLIDEGTATWCNNCPEGMVAVESLQQRYGDNLIVVSTHTGDVMVNAEYFTALGYYDIPRFTTNRNAETSSGTTPNIDSEIGLPAEFGFLDLNAALSDRTVTLDYKIAASKDFDNSSDRYRLGYLFTRDYAMTKDDGKYLQKNSATQPSWDRFYYMPTWVSPELNIHRNVSVDSKAAFSGVEKTLPEEITAWSSMSGTLSISVPEKIDDTDNCRLVLLILDTETGYVHNAESLSLSGSTGVSAIAAEDTDAIRLRMDGDRCLITVSEDISDYSVTLYSMDGRTLYSSRHLSAKESSIDLTRFNGPAVLSVRSARAIASCCVQKRSF